MSASLVETTVRILGKPYQIKCPESEVINLQRAADYLEEQTRSMREGQMLSSDKIIVAAALNVAHQLLTLENQTFSSDKKLQQSLHDLQNKIDHALLSSAQMEFTPSE